MKNKELIDRCNRHIQGGGGCPCKFEYECDGFEDKHGINPYLANERADGKLYTDEELTVCEEDWGWDDDDEEEDDAWEAWD